MQEDMLLYFTELYLNNEHETREPIDLILKEFETEYNKGNLPFIYELGAGQGKLVFYPPEYQHVMWGKLSWEQALNTRVFPYIKYSVRLAYNFLHNSKLDSKYAESLAHKYEKIICRDLLDYYGLWDAK